MPPSPNGGALPGRPALPLPRSYPSPPPPFCLTLSLRLGELCWCCFVFVVHFSFQQENEAQAEAARRKQEQVDRTRVFNEQRKAAKGKFVKALKAHASDFVDYHKSWRRKLLSLGKHCANAQANKEKQSTKQAEREQKERLKALRANDEESYLKLLESAKNERVMMVLKQTEEYMLTMTNLMKQEQAEALASDKREARKAIADGSATGMDIDDEAAGGAVKAPITIDEMAAENGGPQIVQEEDDDDAFVPEEIANQGVSLGQYKKVKEDYNKLARTVDEKVEEQPSILVGGKLKAYQILGLNWLVSLYNNKLNGILADEMGLGKTIQTISLVTHLMEHKNNQGPFFIIVPLSTMPNWQNEFAQWAPSVRVVTYRGVPAARRQLRHEYFGSSGKGFNVLLTTYDFVLRDSKDLSKIKWNYIIIDEGHRIKNADSKLASTLMKAYQSKHRLLLSGTPLQNNLTELWALLNFLLPTIFNSSESFDQWFSQPFASYAGDQKQEMGEEETLLIINRLHQVLRPFVLRRLKKEVESQLPDKVEHILRCELSAWQKCLYSHVREHGIIATEGGGVKRGKCVSRL